MTVASFIEILPLSKEVSCHTKQVLTDRQQMDDPKIPTTIMVAEAQ